MTIGMWVVVGIIALCGFGLSAFLIWYAADDGNAIFAIFGVVCIVLTLAICGVFMWWCTNSESGKRALKEQQSDLNGGLERTVTLYSYNGDEIESWTGKFDVSSSETETYFDIDGKRVIIHGGIVVNEEAE